MSELLRPQPVLSEEVLREQRHQETSNLIGLILLASMNPAFVVNEALPLALQQEIEEKDLSLSA